MDELQLGQMAPPGSERLQHGAPERMVSLQRVGKSLVSDGRAAGDVDRKLGERVRARRLEIGMSQEGLADLLGVTFQQVQKYEKGINRIAASRLVDCAHALEMPVADFFEGLERTRRTDKKEARAEDLLAKPGVVELVRLFVSIDSSKVKRRVIELVRAMVSENV